MLPIADIPQPHGLIVRRFVRQDGSLNDILSYPPIQPAVPLAGELELLLAGEPSLENAVAETRLEQKRQVVEVVDIHRLVEEREQSVCRRGPFTRRARQRRVVFDREQQRDIIQFARLGDAHKSLSVNMAHVLLRQPLAGQPLSGELNKAYQVLCDQFLVLHRVDDTASQVTEHVVPH